MIPSAIHQSLLPLERFEDLRRKAVRFGARLCDLSYANPYQGAQDGAMAALESALGERRLLDLQYTPFGGQTIARRLVADSLRSSHGLPFVFRDVILTPGAMAALQIGLLATVERGSEVVVPTPCWLDYPTYVLHVGASPVLVPFTSEDAPLDVDAIAGAIGPRTRAVLLSHPGNPTGRNYDSATLAALADAIAQRAAALGITVSLIADETHRDFTEPGSYDSLARHYARTLLIYSFGKYHFMQGQRLGYAAVPPHHPERAALAQELERWTRIAGIATPTALMQRAIPKLLTLRYDQTWLARWRQRVVTRLQHAGYGVVAPDATLFVYVRTPAGIDDMAFVEQLAARGVLVLPAGVFHHRGYFRLALTGSEDMLERALDVFEEIGVRCAA
jgi:aspartate aminotransferase